MRWVSSKTSTHTTPLTTLQQSATPMIIKGVRSVPQRLYYVNRRNEPSDDAGPSRTAGNSAE